MKRSNLFLSIVLLFPVLYGQITVAVLDFEANGIGAIENKALSNRLRNELVKVGRYQVFEREMMDEILKEQGFQQSGCVSDECLVTVGKMIGVTHIIGGSISTVGYVTTASVRMINVETGKVLRVTDYDSNTGIESLLTHGMQAVAASLSDVELPVKRATVLKPALQKSGRFFLSVGQTFKTGLAFGYGGLRSYIKAHDIQKAYWQISVGGVFKESYGSGEITYMIPASLFKNTKISAGNGFSLAYYRSNDRFYSDIDQSSGLALNWETFLKVQRVRFYIKYGMYSYSSIPYWYDETYDYRTSFIGLGAKVKIPRINHIYIGVETLYIDGLYNNSTKPAITLSYKI